MAERSKVLGGVIACRVVLILGAICLFLSAELTWAQNYFAWFYYPVTLHNGKRLYDIARISATVHSSGLPYEVCTIGPDGHNHTVLCLVEEGPFTMGSEEGDADEKPVHVVTKTKLYYVSKFPTSNGIFEMWPENKTHRADRGSYSTQDDGPATKVKWTDARDFIAWYGQSLQDLALAWSAWDPTANIAQIEKVAAQYSLPTEAEFEKAAQGKFAASGSAPKYPWGDKMTDDRKIYGRDLGLTNATATASATVVPDSWNTDPKDEYGRLNHMTGNVFCWCSDWYKPDYYKESPASDPTGPTEGKTKVIRGGTWYIYEKSHRVADRSTGFITTADQHTGFRIVRRLDDVGY